MDSISHQDSWEAAAYLLQAGADLGDGGVLHQVVVKDQVDAVPLRFVLRGLSVD